MKIQLFKKG